MKSPIKWVGGKAYLAPTIKELFYLKPHNRLVEPFSGGAAVSFHIKHPNTLINDINPHLINLYNWLQKGLIIDLPFSNSSECYYSMRYRFNELVRKNEINTNEVAQIFYFLNKQGFNGLIRFNKRGEFNTPFGKYAKLNITNDLAEYANVMKTWTISCGDFSQLEIKEGDFVYIDSPYDPGETFTKYSKEDFTWNDHIRLLEWVKTLPASVCVSQQLTPRIIDLWRNSGLHIELVNAPRRISCNGDRAPKMEMLAYKVR